MCNQIKPNSRVSNMFFKAQFPSIFDHLDLVNVFVWLIACSHKITSQNIYSIIQLITAMIQQTTSTPATEALQKALSPTIRTVEKKMIGVKSLKRSLSDYAFDMNAFADASQQVEESIAFPSIEWDFSSDDDNDDHDDDDEVSPAPAKRICRGLSHCPSVPDLASIL